ncbi:MAG: manganese efflux pump [Planctomycetes bacterium]|nr:manganese efflux pump [Planctomycetota bacterium]
MALITMFGIAVALAMDALAVSIAAGIKIRRVRHGHVLRAGVCFGLFQFGMPVIGWFAGKTFARCVCAIDHWIAFALLAALGGKMLYEARGHDPAPTGHAADPTVGWSLLLLSVATSIDALAVGLSLALLGVSIWLVAVIIGVVTCTLSALGILFGGRLGHRFEHAAEAFGGIILIAIGVRILISHLMGG